jgi:transposase-like protein
MVMPPPSSANNGTSRSGVPNPEVLEKAQRRIYSAEYKLRILQETDTCGEGQIGAILRREGLYSSHLTTWRRQRQAGQLAALSDHKRGRGDVLDVWFSILDHPSKLKLINE